MGLEVGWYLRFAKADRIEALVSLKGAPQVRHEAHIFPDWDFEITEFEDHARAVMTRREPLWNKEQP
ncbi:hypothetical protein [Pseudodesulfovibrio indicus]|uniref:Uncharacterized protein n=1 Tax=Pseudodesulfovibrio indicus TaxID=1716143 RepID=A0A126QLG9_9BACT|nr:hypothetical protein [Pseudodesulfovibrio indicus]AMK10822.1 hypothetical protein AWY79_06740 [Pseudodesulfovibrio indicus]TDT91815.1 hypothetical protein EDC59_101217 [Pseudodesulfovibrio indicus]